MAWNIFPRNKSLSVHLAGVSLRECEDIPEKYADKSIGRWQGELPDDPIRAAIVGQGTTKRDLIIDHTFIGSDLIKKLQIEEIRGKHLIIKCDLEELIGYIAAEANHTDDKKIGKKLDRLFERLSRILDKEPDDQ